MIKEEQRFVDSTVFEGMTSIRAILKANDLNINQRRITKILYDADKMNKIAKTVGYLKAVSLNYGFEVIESSAAEIEENTLGNSH